jgi:hypothetical protein
MYLINLYLISPKLANVTYKVLKTYIYQTFGIYALPCRYAFYCSPVYEYHCCCLILSPSMALPSLSVLLCFLNVYEYH